jgi:hypothetical protein
MATKEEVKSTTTAAAFKKAVELSKTAIKQPVKVLNLATGDDDDTVDISYVKYAALPTYNKDTYGATEAAFNEEIEKQVLALLPNRADQLEAILYRVSQNSYQNGKAEAYAKGDYITPDLRSRIVSVMKGYAAFADMTAADCFKSWKKSYGEKKSGAIKALEIARSLGGEDLGEF